MRLSLIIPLFNEEDSLIELNKAIIKVVSSMKIKYEIIYVDDGSTDNSWSIITQLCKSSTNLKGIKFFRNYGKSQALCAGFDLAKGEVVITMDADLQDDCSGEHDHGDQYLGIRLPEDGFPGAISAGQLNYVCRHDEDHVQRRL